MLNGKRKLLMQSIKLLLHLRDEGYDNGLMGAIGELYAEIELGMEKAARGAKGYDGIINGRKVSVKSKERVYEQPSVAYAQINDNVAGLADDLLIVQMDEVGKLSHYLAPLNMLKGRKVAGGVRYYLKEIIAVTADDNK